MSEFLDAVLNSPVESLEPIPHSPIRRTKAIDLTRDQKHDCQLLHSIGWSYPKIEKHTGFTYYQIANACRQGSQSTPKKKSGCPPILTQAQIKELVEFVCASSKNRRMSFQQLAEAMDFGVKKDAIRSAVLKEGFHRCLAMQKPPISETNRRHRLK